MPQPGQPLPSPARPAAPLSRTEWLIVSIAALGFAFDIYELLMMPLIARPALAELLAVDPDTTSGQNAILRWTGYIMWGSAVSGGIFGLLGGYLTDRLGRRRVLVWSILLYAFSALAAGFSTSPQMLLVLRCTTFIGVCVEFVAAVAWLSELFPDPKRREQVLGYTQAFSSVGGLLVTGAYWVCVKLADRLPAIGDDQPDVWRYTLISGLIPAIPLIVIRPFLPESPAWKAKHVAGTLKRPSLAELFRPAFRQTTIVTALLFACGYGAAFGAIQLVPQIVPGLVPEGKQISKLRGQIDDVPQGSPRYKELKEQIKPLNERRGQAVSAVQFFQETGGLLGRFALAFLAVRIVSRRLLLWMFQVPGLLIVPLVFAIPAAGNLGAESVPALKWGMLLAGFFTVGQFSFWGNYLPRMYPMHLRGTGESFAANIGGRMLGTCANPVTTTLAPYLLASVAGLTLPASIAYAAAAVALFVYLAGVVLTTWLPEPKSAELTE